MVPTASPLGHSYTDVLGVVIIVVIIIVCCRYCFGMDFTTSVSIPEMWFKLSTYLYSISL